MKLHLLTPTSTGKLLFLPEDRMRENVYLAAAIYPAALIMYGWTAQNGVIWIVLAIATFSFGVGKSRVCICERYAFVNDMRL